MHPETLTETEEFPTPSKEAGDQSPGPSSPTVRADIAARTHPGKTRSSNEDNFLVVRFGRFLQTMMTSLPDGEPATEYGDAGYGMAVADGMGGRAAGEV